jgi:hypothetical protein
MQVNTTHNSHAITEADVVTGRSILLTINPRLIDRQQARNRLSQVVLLVLKHDDDIAETVKFLFHISSLKFKAWVIEHWLANHLRHPARHAFGYNADDTDRVAKSEAANLRRIAFGFNADEIERIE